MLAVFLVSAAAYSIVSRHNEIRTAPVQVPAVLGASLADAEQALQAAGLSSRIVPEPSDTVASEHVISTDPYAGSSVATGSSVTLTVSSGYPIVEVPDVLAFSGDDAAAFAR